MLFWTQIFSTWGLKNRDLHIWNISKLRCKRNNEWHQTNIKQYIVLKNDNLRNKITPRNKCCKICSRVRQCVLGIKFFLFFCPCKFVKEFKVILFPLDKILEPIPWDDYNFNVVIKAIPGYDMRKPFDIMLLKWSRRRRLHSFLKAWIKSLSLEARNGSFAMFLYL